MLDNQPTWEPVRASWPDHPSLHLRCPAMSFLSPAGLWLLLALPLLPAVYVWLLRRRRRLVVRHSSVAMVRSALASSWRRHVPAVLVFVACALLLVAAARPSARLTLPWARSTVILAIDTSLSMRVSDVKPNRMTAAQQAARHFLEALPPRVDVGLVTFAQSAQLSQRPTADRTAVIAAIDAIQMQFGTAVGDAIVLSLAELFPEQGIDLGALMARGSETRPPARTAPDRVPPRAPEPVAPGSFDAGAIVLLSDGRRTAGLDTLEAARMAADRGVRIYVVGLGVVDGKVQADEGMAIYLRLDEPTLREVARLTGGEYHHAGTAERLRDVYAGLGTRLQVRTADTEVTAFFAGAAAVLLVAGSLLALPGWRMAP
jgi:Ca-activated chloride channel homolog